MPNPNGRPLIHGHRRSNLRSPTYKIWLGMKRRCADPKHKDFPSYGGRGITVCDQWRSSFVAFLADMGERPSLDHEIDRRDPNGRYEPGNCRWTTHAVNSGENKRNAQPIAIAEMQFSSVAAACRHFGVSATTANMRMKDGWPLHLAVTTPTGALRHPRPRASYLRHDHPDRSK